MLVVRCIKECSVEMLFLISSTSADPLQNSNTTVGAYAAVG